MKMLGKLSFLILLLLSFSSKAQTAKVASEPKKLQQFYISLGKGIAFTTSDIVTTSGSHANLLVTATYPSNKIFRAGFSISDFEDNQPATKAFKEDYPDRSSSPHHSLVTPYIAFGKRKLLSKFFQVQALAGVSFTWHHGAEHVYRYVANSGDAGEYEVLDYQMTNRFAPGIVLQAEVMALPLRFAGFTFGGYYNLIPKISHAGLTLSLNLGKIRKKEIL